MMGPNSKFYLLWGGEGSSTNNITCHWCKYKLSLRSNCKELGSAFKVSEIEFAWVYQGFTSDINWQTQALHCALCCFLILWTLPWLSFFWPWESWWSSFGKLCMTMFFYMVYHSYAHQPLCFFVFMEFGFFFLDLEHNDDLAFDSNFFIMGLFLLAYLFNFLLTMNLCDPTKKM